VLYEHLKRAQELDTAFEEAQTLLAALGTKDGMFPFNSTLTD